MILKDGDSRALAGLALDTMKHADPFISSRSIVSNVGTKSVAASTIYSGSVAPMGRAVCNVSLITTPRLLILVNVHEATAITLSKI